MGLPIHSQGIIKSNGIDIYYESFGNPSDSVVLLVMGLGSQCVHWFPYFYVPIVQKGYYVIRFDNRDLGLSSKVSNSYTLEELAADTVGLLDALRLGQAHVIGISMGGMIAQRIAISNPTYVLTLTSIASSGYFSDPTLQPTPTALFLERMARYVQLDRASEEYNLGLWRSLAGSGFPFNEGLHRQLYKQSFKDRPGFNPNAGQNQTQAMIASGSRLAELGSITVPTLVIHGTEDPMIPESHGLRYHPLISGAKYAKMPGVGHEIPEGICSIIHSEIFALLSTKP
jgi:pimeloyl-ACP methyl ester carboxylesterase